jgi:trehalose 6-phosphate phosphatase
MVDGHAWGGDFYLGPTRPILTKTQQSILSTFAASNVLLAFDYDGTLAPIVATPGDARMRPRTEDLLSTITRLYPCVVISGRALPDIADRLSGIPVWHVFGNHGLESGSHQPHPAAQTRAWVHQLEHELAAHPGVEIEDKGLTVTVHYRRAAHRPEAIAAIDSATRRLHGARVLGGNEAVNLLPSGAGDKGMALCDARRAFACETAIYVGDDATDEDAFEACDPHQVLGIRIGAAAVSSARYHVDSQADVDALLETLVALRVQQYTQLARS